MARFSTPSSNNGELAGHMTEFKDNLVALQAQGGIITVGTKYGPAKALRCQVVDPLTGTDHGIRLLFWKPVQVQLTAAHAAGDDWLVGYITEQPQKDDPTKSFYSLTLDENEDLDWTAVNTSLDTFETAAHQAAHPGQLLTVESPF